MARNPLLAVDALRRTHERRATPWSIRLRDVALPLVALAALVPLVQALFLPFLADAPAAWPAGVGRVLLRAGAVVVGWLALDTFSALIRGDDRDVLSVLPVDPGHVVVASLWRVARRRWWLVPAMGVLLGPIAVAGAVDLWVGAVIAVAGSWCLGLTVSSALHLLAVQVSESPSWAPVLDLVRGSNPRPQAAFLYAPGTALLLCGGLVHQASQAVVGLRDAPVLSAVWLAVPFLAAGLAALPLPRLARATWFRASGVLAEIDARYAALADPEEGRRVYLDWAIRWLPPGLHRYALHDLRHGWRARRTLVSGAWLAGLLALAAGWTADPAGPGRAAMVATIGVWLCAAVGVLLAQDEPPFIAHWLRGDDTARGGARALVLGLWLQPIVAPAVLAATARHGVAAGAGVLLWTELSAAGAISLALVCSRWPQRGVSLYAPIAAVLAAVTMAGGLT